MADQQPSDQHAGVPSSLPALSPRGAARRRVAGLGVSGVLLTVASTHAMAADLACRSPSGALSGNPHASHAPEQDCVGGESPKWWYDHKVLLPSKITKHTKFHDILATSRPFGQMSVHNVLQGKGNDGENGVPALMLAMWFNVTVEPRKITFLTAQAVLDMWANYNADYYYNLSGSAKRMDSYDFAEYLKSTQNPWAG